MHSTPNRQIRNPGPRGRSVANQGRRNGADTAEERKLHKLQGRHATEHEIQPNSTAGPPKLR
ncbi:hypothetical protein WGT02_13805 [Rhizobium sp. T1470]|uniref:hypothetical protein n=1 Tax=Rhizobium sp. T1473 TaxID=555321 RepID=UPI0009E78E99|nr:MULTISPECIES: hypothetical protein [Rhizobium]MCA0802293.1 hypothetical protein [Rhizobium sp. T1473]MCS0462616.1 hypothetical protein [Rhizobium favelukesii]UFS84076.1 hypothetical protein LPB79_18125 [Rhizobium sp. T136]